MPFTRAHGHVIRASEASEEARGGAKGAPNTGGATFPFFALFPFPFPLTSSSSSLLTSSTLSDDSPSSFSSSSFSSLNNERIGVEEQCETKRDYP